MKKWAMQCLLVLVVLQQTTVPQTTTNAFTPPHVNRRHSIGVIRRRTEESAGTTTTTYRTFSSTSTSFALSEKQSNNKSPTTTSTRLLATFDDNNRNNHGTKPRRRRGYSGSAAARKNNKNNMKDHDIVKRNWLERATNDICSNIDDLGLGKWHQAVRLLHAWSQFRKVYGPTPLRMEALLKVLVRARTEYGNGNIILDIEVYNTILNAWTCAALFHTMDDDDVNDDDTGGSASPLACCIRAKEIVRYLQRDGTILPNEYSFDVVLHTVLKIEGALEARRFLAWMEYLYKTGKNGHAKPTSGDYIQILEEYAKLPSKQSGLLADGFLTHMEKYLGETSTNDPSSLSAEESLPSTICYNIALKAWGNARKYGLSGRQIAEQADRIVDHMKRRNAIICRPDKFTYSGTYHHFVVPGMDDSPQTFFLTMHLLLLSLSVSMHLHVGRFGYEISCRPSSGANPTRNGRD
jgi:hypothetical protein